MNIAIEEATTLQERITKLQEEKLNLQPEPVPQICKDKLATLRKALSCLSEDIRTVENDNCKIECDHVRVISLRKQEIDIEVRFLSDLRNVALTRAQQNY